MTLVTADVRSRRRFSGRAGVRLALINAIAILVAFGVAGCLALLSIQHFSRHDIALRVQGEAASLVDEFKQKGAARLPHTIEKRERLWRGFDYRLVDPEGRFLAGRLLTGAPTGWREATFKIDGAPRLFLVLTETLPDGGRLSVGQDLGAERAELAAATRSLAVCGAAGALLCLALAYLFNRQAWRRVDSLIETARQVGDGRLEIRAPVRNAREPDDLDQLSRTFNAMLDRTASLLEQLRQVSVDIAHDMRTPLNRVHLKLERLHAQVAGDEALSSKVGVIREDVTEALRVFEALLHLSEIDAGDDARHQPLALSEVAMRVADAFRPDIEESGHILMTEFENAIVKGDSELLSQVVANLLENALRHTPSGTTILLKVANRQNSVLLSVADNGGGVGDTSVEQLLKPFVRREESRSKPGSGLGLSIVSAICRLHHAALKLADARPGLAVELTFPSFVEAR